MIQNKNENFNLQTAFNPGEMTGRSTGADDFKAMPLGRHSIALESLTSQMDKQTSEIQDIMRHSIATNYSFHSKVFYERIFINIFNLDKILLSK